MSETVQTLVSQDSYGFAVTKKETDAGVSYGWTVWYGDEDDVLGRGVADTAINAHIDVIDCLSAHIKLKVGA